MDIGNCIVSKLEKDSNGKVVSMQGKLHLAGDFKTTDKKYETRTYKQT
jgi:hypothetical protein